MSLSPSSGNFLPPYTMIQKQGKLCGEAGGWGVFNPEHFAFFLYGQPPTLVIWRRDWQAIRVLYEQLIKYRYSPASSFLTIRVRRSRFVNLIRRNPTFSQWTHVEVNSCRNFHMCNMGWGLKGLAAITLCLAATSQAINPGKGALWNWGILTGCTCFNTFSECCKKVLVKGSFDTTVHAEYPFLFTTYQIDKYERNSNTYVSQDRMLVMTKCDGRWIIQKAKHRWIRSLILYIC